MAERTRGKQRRSDSRDRGDRSREGGGKKIKLVVVATITITVGVTAVVEAGEAHRLLVWHRTPPRGQLWSNNQSSGHSSVGGMAREERSAWDGSSTPSRSSSFSRTEDHSEATVVAGKRCQEPWQEEHLGLRLSLSCCVC